MENSRFLKIIIIVLLIINIGTLSYLWISRPKHFLHRRPPQNVARFLSRQLNLTKQQGAQYEELQEELHQKIEKLKHRDMQLHHRFFNLLKINPFDSSEVEKVAESIADIQKQIETATFYHFKQIRGILNPKQQSKFDDLIQHTLKMLTPKRPPIPPSQR